MDIDFRTLKYFVAVAEELNFSNAAKRLHISQPPLSLSIKQLEESLETKLFDRSTRKVRLTTEGVTLYKEALIILQHAQSLKKLISLNEASGSIHIGFVGSMLYRKLPQALVSLNQHFPDFKLELTESNSADIIQKISAGQLDLGFVHSNQLPSKLNSATLYKEPFVLCLPANHPLAQKENCSLVDLQEESFIFFNRQASPQYYEILFSLCLGAGFFPKQVHETKHWISILAMVSQNLGVSIVPECLKTSGLPNLKFFSFEHQQRTETALIWLETQSISARYKIIEHLQQFYIE